MWTREVGNHGRSKHGGDGMPLEMPEGEVRDVGSKDQRSHIVHLTV